MKYCHISVTGTCFYENVIKCNNMYSDYFYLRENRCVWNLSIKNVLLLKTSNNLCVPLMKVCVFVFTYSSSTVHVFMYIATER